MKTPKPGDIAIDVALVLFLVIYASNVGTIGFALIIGLQALCGIVAFVLPRWENRETRKLSRFEESWTGLELLSLLSICLLGWSLGCGLAIFGTLLNFNPLQTLNATFLFSSFRVDGSNNTALYIFSSFVAITLLSLVFCGYFFSKDSSKRQYARYHLLLLIVLGTLYAMGEHRFYLSNFFEDAPYDSNFRAQQNYLAITFAILSYSLIATITLVVVLLAVRFIRPQRVKRSNAK